MLTAANTFMVIAIIGVLGMTVLFPLASTFIVAFRNRNKLLAEYKPCHPQSIVVAIPVHNEENTIAGTLKSIQRAVEGYKREYPDVLVQILVGLDNCSDSSAEVVQKFNQINIIENCESSSKWAMMRLLTMHSFKSDWIVFADSGVHWPEDLLLSLQGSFSDDSVLGVGPAYKNPEGGFIENIIWRIETCLKRMEARVGGPVSAHGATVAYRTGHLVKVFRILGDHNWLNDDVVVPVAMHMLFPNKNFEYLDSVDVFDSREASPAKLPGSEFRRRRRMVAGNIQWIQTFLPRLCKKNRFAGVLALRRVFRVFWAYWGLFLGLALTFYLSINSGLSVISVVGLIVLMSVVAGFYFRSVRVLYEAAIASLLAPYYLIFSSKPEVVWR